MKTGVPHRVELDFKVLGAQGTVDFQGLRGPSLLVANDEEGQR